MVNIITEPSYDFDDVYIVPVPSELSSRSQVNLNVAYICKHSKQMFYGCPIVISNMDSTGQINIAKVAHNENVWTALHKFYTDDKIVEFTTDDYMNKCFISIGISDTEFHRIKRLKQRCNIHAICIDAANAYMYSFLDMIKRVRNLLPNTIIMAGNVCTPEGVENIIKAGADIAKCGIANGSFCQTKNKTGVNIPQFSVAKNCGQAANELNALCCSDGGCREPQDICKGLGAGAHLIMIGSMVSGVSEAIESEWVDGKMRMYGMSSTHANNKYFGGLKSYRTSEGREEFIDSKGSILDIIADIKGGLASCCTYTNTKNVENLHKNCSFIVYNYGKKKCG